MIDTAGFGETKNYVRMIGVSYGLQAIFDHLDEAKFIIVVPESELTATDGQSFFQSLNYFLNMFRIKELDED